MPYITKDNLPLETIARFTSPNDRPTQATPRRVSVMSITASHVSHSMGQKMEAAPFLASPPTA